MVQLVGELVKVVVLHCFMWTNKLFIFFSFLFEQDTRYRHPVDNEHRSRQVEEMELRRCVTIVFAMADYLCEYWLKSNHSFSSEK